jgi:hypothetical protein
MTWYADEIILRASTAALEAVRAASCLAPFAYHIRALDGHAWVCQEQRHGLPEGGLLVIRPVCDHCDRSSHRLAWYEVATRDWATLPFEPGVEELLDTTMTQRLSKYLEEETEAIPPLQLRKAVASLAAHLNQPVLYYSCSMWGGDICYEYSLVYEPAESVIFTRPHVQSDTDTGNDVENALRAGLLKIGLSLPTVYFAPHTRCYPWQMHKLR